MVKKYMLWALVVCAVMSQSSYAQTTSVSTTSTVNSLPPMGQCGVTVFPDPNEDQYEINWNASLSNVQLTNKDYYWAGSDNLYGNDTQYKHTYSSPGLKTGTVTIRGVDKSYAFTCTATLPNTLARNRTQRIGGSCQPLIQGMTVNWSANISGYLPGNAISYQWFGSDGLSTTTQNVSHTYTTEGLKTANVIVRAGPDSLAMSCQALIASTSANCFIATAAYGTDKMEEVQTLRHFRDAVLLDSEVGRKFVESYYEISPPIADYIREKESLKSVVRLGLSPIAHTLKSFGY